MIITIVWIFLCSERANGATSTKCGPDRWCYFVDVYPSENETETEVNITNTDDSSSTYFEIAFRSYTNDCINPTVSLDFELIDYFENIKFLEVFDENNDLIMQCQGGAQQCRQYAVCLDKYVLGSAISTDVPYKLTIFEPVSVNASCLSYHPYSINAYLTLSCDEVAEVEVTTAPAEVPTPSPGMNVVVNYTSIESNLCQFSNIDDCAFSIPNSLFCCHYINAKNVYDANGKPHYPIQESAILDVVKLQRDLSLSILVLFAISEIAACVSGGFFLYQGDSISLAYSAGCVGIMSIVLAILSAVNFGILYHQQLQHGMDLLLESNCYTTAASDDITGLSNSLQYALDYNLVIMILCVSTFYVTIPAGFAAEQQRGWFGMLCTLATITWVLIPVNYNLYAEPLHTNLLHLSATTDQLCYQPVSSEHFTMESISSSPTLSPTTDISPPTTSSFYEDFPGSSLVIKGFNIFQNERSGTSILDSAYNSENIVSYSNEGSVCAYQSLTFTSSYSSYAEYAESDSAQIAVSFNTAKGSAGASSTRVRVQTRSTSKKQQTQIYSMNLDCQVAEVSVAGYDTLFWDVLFVNQFRILPQEYTTGDTLEPYFDFWNQFGTHFMLSANLGGSIRGAITVDKCTAINTFTDSKQFETCLNAGYQGIEVDACGKTSDTSTMSQTALTAILNTKITVKGGDTGKFTEIFNTFNNKETDFQNWINDLKDLPDIVGGNLNEIHDVIEGTVRIGNHQLNKDLSSVVSDETFTAIAVAMRAAYNDYALQISDEDVIFDDGECQIECYDGNVTVSECVCSGCKKQCCSAADANTDSSYRGVVGLQLYICSVLFVFCLL